MISIIPINDLVSIGGRGMRKRLGRPRNKLPKASAVITRRVRRLIDLAHEGNLNEASRVTGIPHPTLRDLYLGRTVNPSLQTLEALRKPYDIYLQWFTDPKQPEEVPRAGLVGLLPPNPPVRGRPSFYREVVIPYAAWPMYDVFTTLHTWLDQQARGPKRPIVGDTMDKEFIQRLTSFLFGPLLAVEQEFGGSGAVPIATGLLIEEDAKPEAREQWVRTLRSLGKMWQLAIPAVLAQASKRNDVTS